MSDVVIYRRTVSDEAAPVTSGAEVKGRDETQVMVNVGGRMYPAKTEQQCHTCMSPFRKRIEKAMLMGAKNAAILQDLPESAELTSKQLSRHFRKHMPMAAAVRRGILEERAKELGRDLETVVGHLVDHISFARVGLQTVYERMMEGEIQPTISEGIGFARLLQQAEAMAGGAEVDESLVHEAFMAWNRAINRNTSPEQVAAIAAEIGRDPILAGLRAKAKAREQALEAESWESEDETI